MMWTTVLSIGMFEQIVVIFVCSLETVSNVYISELCTVDESSLHILQTK